MTGFLEGETCGREGCAGVIAEHPVEGCSCHINPPCYACSTPREYCPECEWEAKDDTVDAEGTIYLSPYGAYVERTKRVLDRSKIDYSITGHSNSSQKVTGVFPKGTTRDEVKKQVDGTFGGRFERWDADGGNFTFIAYTD